MVFPRSGACFDGAVKFCCSVVFCCVTVFLLGDLLSVFGQVFLVLLCCWFACCFVWFASFVLFSIWFFGDVSWFLCLCC